MNKNNHNCKMCNDPMFRDMRNVKSRTMEGVVNWLGFCSKHCMEKMKKKELSELLIDGRVSYLMDIQRELSRKPNEI